MWPSIPGCSSKEWSRPIRDVADRRALPTGARSSPYSRKILRTPMIPLPAGRAKSRTKPPLAGRSESASSGHSGTRFVCAVEGRAAALSPRKLERPGVGGLGPRLGRRGVVSSTKSAVEMGQIREARVKRDGRNGAAAKAGIGQKAVGQFQTPRQHEFREG